MYRYFKGKVRKFLVDPPDLLEDIIEDHMPYMGTVNPADDFDDDAAEARAKELKEACDGLGTNEARIIDILAHHSNEQRQAIKAAYDNSYEPDLESELKGELRSDFEDIVVGLLATPRVYDARELREAVQGAGTDEGTIIEIMCTRTYEEIEGIKEAYTQEYERDLESDLKGDTKGCFEKLLISLCNGGRDESSQVDKDQAEADAQTIFDAGEGQWGTDEAAINDILAERNYDQLKATFKAYNKLSERDIEEAIDKECSGSQQDAFLAIMKCARDTGRFFAARLHKALKGAGTDERTLLRIVVSRSELDLAAIAELYEIDYEVKLYQAIASDCKGDFKKILLALLGDLAE